MQSVLTVSASTSVTIKTLVRVYGDALSFSICSFRVLSSFEALNLKSEVFFALLTQHMQGRCWTDMGMFTRLTLPTESESAFSDSLATSSWIDNFTLFLLMLMEPSCQPSGDPTSIGWIKRSGSKYLPLSPMRRILSTADSSRLQIGCKLFDRRGKTSNRSQFPWEPIHVNKNICTNSYNRYCLPQSRISDGSPS